MDYPTHTVTLAEGVIVSFQMNATNNPPGKLADAELHFSTGALSGLKLIGFAIWESRGEKGRRNVTFPARQYSVNGERRSFALLRPITTPETQEAFKALIVDAFAQVVGSEAVS